MTTERIEDYLEAIYLVEQEKGYAQGRDLVTLLGVNPSSITGMLKKLAEEGYINHQKYGGITLTKKGKTLGEKTLKKHNTLTEFFLILDLPKDIAESDACRIEHVVHAETMEKLSELIKKIKNGSQKEDWKEFHKKIFNLTAAQKDGPLP